MEFWEVIQRRHSVREFDAAREVPAEAVQKILETAIHAPSGGNCQPWHFVVVRESAARQALAAAAHGQQTLQQAPVVIAVCSDPARSAAYYGRRGQDLYALLDTGAASAHILLAATAQGLGSCWISAFDDDAVARILRLPEQLRPIALIALGFERTPGGRRTPRRPIEEVVTYR